MSPDNLKRAADMLLHGATLLAEPCPYCSGVRVLKSGQALCISCGTKPETKKIIQENVKSIEQQMLELTRQLGSTTDTELRSRLMDAISDMSRRMVQKPSLQSV